MNGHMDRARRRTYLLAVGSLVLIVGGALAGMRPPAPAPAYGIAAVQAALAHHPRAWVGRIVRVRGMAEPCPWWGATMRLWHCADDPLILVPDRGNQMAASLPLSQPAPYALLAVLRGLPLLPDLVARERAVPLYTPARFRVQLHGLVAQACGGRSPCYEAVLLDVASSQP